MAWAWLRRGERSQASAGHHVLFYTRNGCHLCEEAWETVAAACKKHGFTLTAVDVDADPALARHGECVPVVSIDGKVRFRGRVNAVLLERMLRGERGA